MSQIVHTDEFEAWFLALDDNQAKAVAHVVTLLELKGLSLGHPYSSDLKGTRFPFRELRTHRFATALRIVYAYSPERNAVLLLGGDKTGNPRFYDEMLPRAEKVWKQYLAERDAELAREKAAAARKARKR